MTTDPNELIVGYDEADGLNKREYFAALAMQGILANGAIDNLAWNEIASDAVGFADALIAALNAEGQADG